MVILLFVVGLVILVLGAEALVRGASRVAAALGVSPLIIGLTVVAFGTSSPELAVSTKAAVAGAGDIAVGNVVGSNIFNVLLILGISAALVPLVVSQQLVRFDVPLMIALSVLLLILSLDGNIGRADGLIMVAGLVGYMGYLLYESRRESAEVRAEYAREFGAEPAAAGGWLRNIGMVVVGLALLVLGSDWLVDGAVAIARHLGVSELVIGLTIVAAGTSLPEVGTSVVAALRGERDIAIGNVVGSNIFNIMGVLGIASVVAPNGIEVSSAAIGFDMPVMIAVAVACLPIFFTGGVISRPEGVLFLGYYVAYTVYLVLAASHHAALPKYSGVMLYFVIPFTVIALTFLALRELGRRHRSLPK
jgi:cation:H+ antiporter